jgi:hypothetical protein
MLSSLTNSLSLGHSPRIIRTSKSYNAFFDLPGFKPNDLSVSVDEHEIRIQGKSKSQDNFERHVESHFTLPIDADTKATMQAILENGVLRLIVPIEKSERPSLGKNDGLMSIGKRVIEVMTFPFHSKEETIEKSKEETIEKSTEKQEGLYEKIMHPFAKEQGKHYH